MKVLITGGAGSVGRAVVERLVQGGWDVLVVGRRPDMQLPGARYASCDITRFEAVCEHASGCDAVVHLAAIAAPTGAPGPDIIRVNVHGTFNVFEAAAKAGIKRVVQASSINAFGCWWGVVDLRHVRYFPIDEEHKVFTTDPYSFSKQLDEEIGRYYWRRDGVTSFALRLPWVHGRDLLVGEAHRQRVCRERAVLDELAALPPEVLAERLAEARRKAVEYRRQRPLEFGAEASATFRDAFADDPFCRMYFSSRCNFWAFVDERDSAQAVEKALTAACEGSHVLFVNDSHNWVLYDTETLLRIFFPEVTQRKGAIRGTESLVSIDKARELIGFEPEFSAAGGP